MFDAGSDTHTAVPHSARRQADLLALGRPGFAWFLACLP